jgi:hypothetical protein
MRTFTSTSSPQGRQKCCSGCVGAGAGVAPKKERRLSKVGKPNCFKEQPEITGLQ